jgi:hypothetical protein
MVIETRVVGKKARSLDRWSVPTPPASDDSGDGGITLRELIANVVRSEVTAFEQRAKSRRLIRVLSDVEIADAAALGKVDSGGRPAGDPVDPDVAIAAALQGFEDGLYLVILDGVEQRALEAQVYLSPNSQLVFLRLTFLAGA